MKLMETDKYTIAWFKLAECVSRGEREKALGVYRLLLHSLDDQAYAAQLEGDLLWAFGDARAVAKYTNAAQMYQNQVRLKQAAAVYEHVYQLNSTDRAILEQLIVLYDQLGDIDARHVSRMHYISLLCDAHEHEVACQLVDEWSVSGNSKECIDLYNTLIVRLCVSCPARKERIVPYVHKLLDAYIESENNQGLQLFLTQLRELNAAYFKEAQIYLSR